MIVIKQCPICGSERLKDYLQLKDYFLSGESFGLSQCRECGFVFTNPRPNEVDLPKYYDSSEYLSHHSRGLNLLTLTYKGLRWLNIRKKFSFISKYLSRGDLLDIGCGTGEVLSYFRHKRWCVKGIEPNRVAREAAIKNYGLDIGDESELDLLPIGSFDVITMWHVLEHLSDLHSGMDNIFRLLKKPGYLILACPNLKSWDAVYYGKYWAAFDVPRHLYHFTKETIKLLGENHHFTYIGSFPMKMDAFYVSMLSEKYLRKRNPILFSLLNGFRSNSFGKKTEDYSSMIYVFKK